MEICPEFRCYFLVEKWKYTQVTPGPSPSAHILKSTIPETVYGNLGTVISTVQMRSLFKLFSMWEIIRKYEEYDYIPLPGIPQNMVESPHRCRYM